MLSKSFWKGKNVLVTGHTGFKGTWLCGALSLLGANVFGYALAPEDEKSLYDIVDVKKCISSTIADIRDLKEVVSVLMHAKPDIVFHLAAQPIVREGYKNPHYTYDVNVMGTVNILEAVRLCSSVHSFVNVTTDKVYKNNEWVWGYRETDELNGYDPYSNSKSCSELVTGAYKRSFLEDCAVSACRAGNVIGGGDFSTDRIIPDCYRAACAKREIIIRNPSSIRPYQHVLEPITAYMTVAQKQYENPEQYQGSYNVAPKDKEHCTTLDLVKMFCQAWGNDVTYTVEKQQNAPHEANVLSLDCSKIESVIGWRPVWSIQQAVEKTVEWYKAYNDNADSNAVMNHQIYQYLRESGYEI